MEKGKPTINWDKCEAQFKLMADAMTKIRAKKLMPQFESAVQHKDYLELKNILLETGVDATIIPAIIEIASDHKLLMFW